MERCSDGWGNAEQIVSRLVERKGLGAVSADHPTRLRLNHPQSLFPNHHGVQEALQNLRCDNHMAQLRRVAVDSQCLPQLWYRPPHYRIAFWSLLIIAVFLLVIFEIGSGTCIRSA